MEEVAIHPLRKSRTAGVIRGQVTGGDESTEILLVGCGARFGPAPAGLARTLRAAGVALEWMDTGAACRTFNVLLAEDRLAAAALIAVE